MSRRWQRVVTAVSVWLTCALLLAPGAGAVPLVQETVNLAGLLGNPGAVRAGATSRAAAPSAKPTPTPTGTPTAKPSPPPSRGPSPNQQRPGKPRDGGGATPALAGTIINNGTIQLGVNPEGQLIVA